MARGTAPTAAAPSAAALALKAALEQDERAAIERLVYVDDSQPGWRRLKRGSGFRYVDSQGRGITDPDQLSRIRRLAIPPAYTDVWICPLEHGHIQATGRDARGRKQYRYHELWQAMRGATKFARMREFGLALPRIRRRVERDLALPGLPRDKVLATLVRLLDTTYLRVGNDEYARTNGSYGLTTLRNRHVAVKGGTLRLSFRGKSGVHQRVELDDPKVARICARLQELPGQELFQCVDEDGELHTIGSADVNDYIAAAASPARRAGTRTVPDAPDAQRFTAKDFRTWHASALALERLHPCEAGSAADARRRVKEVIAEVARQLGHTLSVCRKSYVHPDVLSHFAEGRLQAVCEGGAQLPPGQVRGLKPAEKQLLALLSAAARPARSAARRPVPAAPGRKTARRPAPAQTTA
ncbi:DNA topoisomerase IB [Ideonella sp. BN130291]|uniref:DNA topoisomerase IB n=1 Tax=Ideonella sp. BN130291 TaxID=3112940 RepID=UPI002E26C81B|nr:DNA topoisomerase IB [Ideonella sp. BN130291]